MSKPQQLGESAILDERKANRRRQSQAIISAPSWHTMASRQRIISNPLNFPPYLALFSLYPNIAPCLFMQILSPICPLGHLHAGDWTDLAMPTARGSLRGLSSA
ncbi:hypothetical protein [Rhizobium mayense]|uniref:Uncharacterized protein n=1 Tax=Rhizobium mayense TaxID=1312184 RepID=A0ABT7JN10_9HYPH|nr:hypothetical protein [Rhizobium mayense]MDL2397731.1 hypothetical protein [Rhizobium mayense]